MTVAGCIAQPRLTGGLHLRDLHYGLDCSFRHLAHNGAGNPGELAGRLPKVTFTHDVVAVEDTPCLVTGYLHCNPLRNPSPDHIPNSRTPQVMEQEFRHSDPNPRNPPCLIKAPHRFFLQICANKLFLIGVDGRPDSLGVSVGWGRSCESGRTCALTSQFAPLAAPRHIDVHIGIDYMYSCPVTRSRA